METIMNMPATEGKRVILLSIIDFFDQT